MEVMAEPEGEGGITHAPPSGLGLMSWGKEKAGWGGEDLGRSRLGWGR